MNRFIRTLIVLVLINLWCLSEGSAQGVASAMNTEEAVTMADTMRSNGKIYVVLAVVLLIQAGLFVMLWSLDRKLSKLEA